ncbi:nucleoside recognition domain-containing protein [Desulfovibrio litoralis]|uniref:Nucleoside transporter/FeoB GTPase Gate domain-containing protein n=1 Tax=Desulfovibrio litoralis DSM 11393 TaxID=1121455 RepID=A0A1M7T6B1_9BACT|nr:nucleoside recognition domain-containing protein [Desulfovibrio litoralis]SHN66239.1 hypothetical protein SAMN02745728_01599 [Desulfovibrio litoralis DSM 11393]
MNSLFSTSIRIFKEETRHSLRVFYKLVTMVLPVIILVKIATELKLINYLALPLEPIMSFVGLPKLMGLVLATGMIAGINSSILLYISLMPELGPVSVADISVFSVMLLIAHGLPVEGRVSSYCGFNFWRHVVLRLSGALSAGFILRQIYTYTGYAQEPAKLFWNISTQNSFSDNPWILWGISQAKSFSIMFVVIWLLIVIMRILKELNLLQLLNGTVSPFLRLLGISKNASSITVIGMLAGLLYGGGLIMEEVRKGQVDKKDVFAAMFFMSLTHSIIEDTALLMLIGADFYGIFVFRILFSFILTAVFMQFFSKKNGNNTLATSSS